MLLKKSGLSRVSYRPIFLLLAGAIGFIGCASSERLKVGAVPGGEVIEAEGSCPVVSGDVRGAKECSLRDAQKKAVEKVVGVYVSAKTRVEKAVTIEQNILANTQGYISKYDVVKEGRDGDYYNTTVRALIMFQKISDDLKSLNVLREPSVGLPRVAVIVSDLVGKGGKTSGDDTELHTYAANSMGESLIKAGYKVVDPEAVMAAKAYESIDEAENNPSAMNKLGTKLNAEIIIFGDAKASPVQMDPSMLGGMKSYRATLSAKAARVQTGEVIQNVSGQASGLDAVEDAALQKALETVGKKAGDDLGRDMHNRLLKEASISLTATNISGFTALEELKKTLSSTSGVRDLFLRSFDSNNANIDVYLEALGKVGVSDLASRLTDSLKVTVVRMEGNTLEVALP
ncbi:MAG: hypothetical protein HY547_04605 [Elusimicrobia bacterium]|nr:hypothetical protein [Elusimicrobiota bacterium]